MPHEIPSYFQVALGTAMAKVKQLAISLENKPGRLAAVAKVLADAKVNIGAILGSTAGAQGSVQVVVDNLAKAKKALSAAQVRLYGRIARTGGASQQVRSSGRVHREAGQEGREHRCSVWNGSQRSEEIGAVFCYLKKGWGIAAGFLPSGHNAATSCLGRA
jgi:hypothetical protein